jgi:NTP pyrophosphatase (non-canonical NTP hydrolase)
MISWFTEEAIFPLITGGILSLVFIILAYTSREKNMLFVGLIIAALAGGVFVCEQLIVTEKEEITAVVYELAEAVRNNDTAGVVKHISPTRADTIARAEGEMPRYLFDICRLAGITKYEDDATNPKAKKITFTVNFRVALLPDRTPIPGQRAVVLTFERNAGGQWKITDYSHHDPRGNVRL